MIKPEEADEKVKEGWLRAWLVFEVLAIDEKVAKDSLESLVNKLENDKRVMLYKKQFSDSKKLEKPLGAIKEGFSIVCEIEFVTKNFDKLIQTVLEYGPSAAELLEPKELKILGSEAQGILNSIAQMMHSFATAGIGGMVVIKGE